LKLHPAIRFLIRASLKEGEGFLERLSVQLVPQVGMLFQEDVKGLGGLLERSFDACGKPTEKSLNPAGGLLNFLGVCDNHQFIEVGDTIFLEGEDPDFLSLKLDLNGLVVSECPDHGIHLSGQQGRYQVKTNPIELVVGGLEARIFRHGMEEDLIKGGDGVAYLAAFEIRGALKTGGLEKEDGTQGMLDQGPYGGHGQAFGASDDDAWLVTDGELHLSGGDELQGIMGVGRHHQVDIQAFFGKIPLVLGHVEGYVIGIGEPIQHAAHLLIGHSGLNRPNKDEKKEKQNHIFFCQKLHGAPPKGFKKSFLEVYSCCFSKGFW